MFLALCRVMYTFVIVHDQLFKFIFAGIDNPRYDSIRPSDAFLAMYLCGSMPFIPVSSGLIMLFLGNMWSAMLAFLLGTIGAPLIIKVVWKVAINFMLITGGDETETG